MATHVLRHPTEVHHPASSTKALNVVLWGAQVLLAIIFGIAGLTHVTQSMAHMAKQQPWVASAPLAVIRFVAFVEIAGALGVILPAATRIKPILTPLAATGLCAIMALATLLHLSRGEAKMLPITIPIGLVAAFVAWGRARKVPIPDRTRNERGPMT